MHILEAMHRWVALATVVCACAGPPRAAERRALERPVIDDAAVAAVAARPEVVTLDGDVALLCGPAAPATDHDDAAPDCDAAIVGAGGTLTELGRGGLLAAGRLDRSRLLLLTRERTLIVRAGGRELELARDVADPRLAPDRRAVAFTQLPAGATSIDPTTTGRLVLLDLDRGTRRLVTEHPLDSSPFVRPGTDDVLFVSGRTGLASLFLARPGQPARQLTNVGAREVGPGFVPVPGRELVWLDGGRVAVYTATYGGVATLWALDVETAAAAPIGRGRWPRATDDATRIAALDDAGRPVAFAAVAIEQQLATAPIGGAP